MSNVFPAVQGVLIKTDIPTKQLIMYLDEVNKGCIVLQDLDDTHVLIDQQYVDFIRQEIDQTMDRHNFERGK